MMSSNQVDQQTTSVINDVPSLKTSFPTTLTTRDHDIFLAKLAGRVERHEDVIKYLTSAVKEKPVLNNEERNLLSVSFKYLVGSRRISWRHISTLEHKEETRAANAAANSSSSATDEQTLAKQRFQAAFFADIQSYRQIVETELENICRDAVNLLDQHLIKAAEDDEARVFYIKMKADYLRYMAEFMKSDSKDKVSQEALSAYQEASKIAQQSMSPTLPIRLGLALNFSVFFYEILGAAQQACELAQSAFDEAFSKIDTLNEESYKDSTMIMSLLRDNLSLWKSEMQQQTESGKQSKDEDSKPEKNEAAAIA